MRQLGVPGTIVCFASPKNQGPEVLEGERWRALKLVSPARAWTPDGDPHGAWQSLAGGESVGVCHRVSERFRETTNRKR